MNTFDLQVIYNYIVFNKSILLVGGVDIIIAQFVRYFWNKGYKKELFVVSLEEQRKKRIYKVVAVVSIIMFVITTIFLIINIHLASICERYLKIAISDVAKELQQNIQP